MLTVFTVSECAPVSLDLPLVAKAKPRLRETYDISRQGSIIPGSRARNEKPPTLLSFAHLNINLEVNHICSDDGSCDEIILSQP